VKNPNNHRVLTIGVIILAIGAVLNQHNLLI
jgi:hypothetical protein